MFWPIAPMIWLVILQSGCQAFYSRYVIILPTVVKVTLDNVRRFCESKLQLNHIWELEEEGQFFSRPKLIRIISLNAKAEKLPPARNVKLKTLSSHRYIYGRRLLFDLNWRNSLSYSLRRPVSRHIETYSCTKLYTIFYDWFCKNAQFLMNVPH